jgi:glutamate--cysteine ligase
MYDQSALDAAWDLVKGWDDETRQGLRVAASERALQGEANGVKLLDIARAALDLSRQGLAARARHDARGRDETHFLDILDTHIVTGRTQADDLLDRFAGNLTGVYEATSL